jgi:hypothetical protein
MAMEAAPTSPQLTTYAQNNVAVTHAVSSTHNAVNLIQPDQSKGLFIVDPSQQHALQMYANDRTFMSANSVEYNATPGAITVPVSNGNNQIMVSHMYFDCPGSSLCSSVTRSRWVYLLAFKSRR